MVTLACSCVVEKMSKEGYRSSSTSGNIGNYILVYVHVMKYTSTCYLKHFS